MKRRRNRPAIMELPGDLIVGVIVKLPLRDILISKRVCKSWYNLISNPNFTNYYAKNSPFTTVFLTKDCGYKEKSLSFLEFAGDGEFTVMPFNPKTPLVAAGVTPADVCIIEFCNDRIFLLHHKSQRLHEIYMYSPFGGSCVKALEYDFSEPCWTCWLCKAGYIPSADTYKIVRIRFVQRNVRKAFIFTVGSDRGWRDFDDLLSFQDFRSTEVICFNGAYHWAPERNDDICTFDLLEEKTGPVISKPLVNWKHLSVATRMVVYKDRLSLVNHTSDAEIVIWTMKEYGVTESWSIDVVLRVWAPNPLGLSVKDFFPILVLPNGCLLYSEKYIGAAGSLMSYSFEKRLSTLVKVVNVVAAERHTYKSANTNAPRFHPLDGELKRRGRVRNLRKRNICSSCL